MPQIMSFGDVLEAADQLPFEDQEELVKVLKRRMAEAGRRRVVETVRESREQFARGECVEATPDEIMREILE